MWYNSLWLWRWLLHRLSKRQSLSTTTVLFTTTFTRTIKLKLLLKKKTLSQTNNTATIKSAIQLLALKQFSLSGHLKLQMYKNAVNYTSYTCSCIMDRSIFLLEFFSNLLLISNAIIWTHQDLGWLVIT